MKKINNIFSNQTIEWKEATTEEVLDNIKKACIEIRNGKMGSNPYTIDCRILVNRSYNE